MKQTPRPHWSTFGKGKPRRTDEMNKTEAAYAETLEARKLDGEILWYKFGCISLRIAASGKDVKGAWYKTDFIVMLASGQIELHEVKGFWTKDATIRIKVAAEKFPFRFIAVMRRSKKDGGGWAVTDFSGGET